MKTVFHITAGVLHIFIFAWVLVHLWAWFVVPLGVPAISMAHAYGLTGLISYPFLPIFARMATDPKMEEVPLCVLAIVIDGLAYLSGAVAHWIMVSP